jgi:hypothetical protein
VDIEKGTLFDSGGCSRSGGAGSDGCSCGGGGAGSDGCSFDGRVAQALNTKAINSIARNFRIFLLSPIFVKIMGYFNHDVNKELS